MTSRAAATIELGFLDEHVGFQVHLCRRAIAHSLRAAIKQKTGRRPSGTNSALILIGANPGIAPKQLAAALFLDPQATDSVLDRLESEKLAERSRSEKDRRRVELNLTVKGRKESILIEQRSTQQEDKLTSGLTTEERETLVRLLSKVRSNVASDGRALMPAQA